MESLNSIIKNLSIGFKDQNQEIFNDNIKELKNLFNKFNDLYNELQEINEELEEKLLIYEDQDLSGELFDEYDYYITDSKQEINWKEIKFPRISQQTERNELSIKNTLYSFNYFNGTYLYYVAVIGAGEKIFGIIYTGLFLNIYQFINGEFDNKCWTFKFTKKRGYVDYENNKLSNDDNGKQNFKFVTFKNFELIINLVRKEFIN